MSVTIHKVIDASHRAEIFRLRYSVYVREKGDRALPADHQAQAISDALDQSAILLGAFDQGRLIGTVRGNDAGKCSSELVAKYGMAHSLALFPGQVSVTTRLVLDPAHRAGLLAARLCKAMFEHYTSCGVRYDFIDCQEHMRFFFLRLGYRPGAQPFTHPESGLQHFPMVLDLTDHAHLVRVRSPFASLAVPMPVVA